MNPRFSGVVPCRGYARSEISEHPYVLLCQILKMCKKICDGHGAAVFSYVGDLADTCTVKWDVPALSSTVLNIFNYVEALTYGHD